MTSRSLRAPALLALMLLVLGTACSSVDSAPPAPDLDKVYGDWRPPAGYPYPVVVPFDITKKGTTVRVPFSVPPRLPLQRTDRPVHVVLRISAVRGPVVDMSRPDTPSMRRSQANIAARDRFDREPVPIRVRVWRVDGEHRIPVVLKDREPVAPPPSREEHWIERESDVFIHHRPEDTEQWRLMALGLQDRQRWYHDKMIAGMPRVPGEYVLEAEVLGGLPDFNGNPEADPMAFELLISTPQEPAF